MKTKKSLIVLMLGLVVTLVMCITACNNASEGPSVPETPTYTITYDANGATAGTVPEVQIKTKGTALNLASNSGNLEKTGYTFTGWNTKADGTGTDYEVEVSYSEDAELTLYAKWISETPTYTITYDANGATAGTVPEVQIKTEGTALNLASNSGNLEKTGYAFAGWNTKANGTGTDYEVEVSYSEDAELTLYAKWVVMYQINYTLNGGTWVADYIIPDKYIPTQKVILPVAANLTREGYEFKGWSYSLDGPIVTEIDAGYQGTQDLYAQWIVPNITINGVEFDKTSAVEVIAKDKTVNIKKQKADSWPNYAHAGIFTTNYDVTLSSFIMSKYEVTQELYKAVMNINPSFFCYDPATDETQELRPVERVTWYDAIAFCNELTKLTMTESDCVYNITILERNATIQSITKATVTEDYTKKGYRLPTEAEWEFAARGGVPYGRIWGYAYPGIYTFKKTYEFGSGSEDYMLNDYGWYKINSNAMTHEIGLKTENSLGLYDMSGNVLEWCYDNFQWEVNLQNLTVVTNPICKEGYTKVVRGGNFNNEYYKCGVSYRVDSNAESISKNNGFRVCRTQ